MARSTNRRIEPEETIGPNQMTVPFPRWQHGSGDIPPPDRCRSPTPSQSGSGPWENESGWDARAPWPPACVPLSAQYSTAKSESRNNVPSKPPRICLIAVAAHGSGLSSVRESRCREAIRRHHEPSLLLQAPLLAQVYPRQPQLVVGEVGSKVLPDGAEEGAAADAEGELDLVQPFAWGQEMGQIEDFALVADALKVSEDCGGSEAPRCSAI